MDGAGFVRARVVIYQCPLDSAPLVPKGQCGHVEDVADDLLWVDFGEPYGVVACEPEECN